MGDDDPKEMKWNNGELMCGTDAGEPGIYNPGGRSYSIWKWDGSSDGLTLVHDSGDQFETVIANKKVDCQACVACTKSDCSSECADCTFNCGDVGRFDDRSKAKGPEPECVEIANPSTSYGTQLAFIGMERTSGIMTF